VEDEPVEGQQLGQRAERVRERRRVLVGVHEQERPPGLEAKRNERDALLVEVRLALRARSGAERAVEPVRPRVVRALHRLPGVLALDEERSAVAADVEERARPALVPQDEHRHLAGPGGEPVADVLDAPGMADVLPRPPEDALLFAA
jgi:hypothetical protein